MVRFTNRACIEIPLRTARSRLCIMVRNRCDTQATCDMTLHLVAARDRTRVYTVISKASHTEYNGRFDVLEVKQ